MGTHLLSISTVFVSEILLICGHAATHNPQLAYAASHQPHFNLYTPVAYNVYPQRGIFPYHQQLLGPYYQSSIGRYFPYNWGLSSNYHIIEPKIVGGFPVPEGLVPFMAHLNITKASGDETTCGGTLITPRHILTAAHCVSNISTDPIKIDVIMNSISRETLPETAVKRNVIAVKTHELFQFIELSGDRIANEYDIAILTLNENVTTVKPVKLASGSQTAEIQDYKRALITGWGRTKWYTPGGSDVLLGTVLNLLSQDDYNKLKREDLPSIKETQISAVFRPGGRGTCNGDSGGPLMADNEEDGYLQIGVTSYGNPTCGSIPNSPSVFTRVSQFFDWIILNTGAS